MRKSADQACARLLPQPSPRQSLVAQPKSCHRDFVARDKAEEADIIRNQRDVAKMEAWKAEQQKQRQTDNLASRDGMGHLSIQSASLKQGLEHAVKGIFKKTENLETERRVVYTSKGVSEPIQTREGSILCRRASSAVHRPPSSVVARRRPSSLF